MSISDKDMAHLKTLARLELSPDETQSLKDDLNKILESFERIRHLDTDNALELARPVATQNIFREDNVIAPLPRDVALALATEEEDGFFKVPRTVDAD